MFWIFMKRKRWMIWIGVRNLVSILTLRNLASLRQMTRHTFLDNDNGQVRSCYNNAQLTQYLCLTPVK